MRPLPGFDKRLLPAFREVARALGRLDVEQGLVGRRNARQALSKAERKLRGLVDDLYPAMRRKPKPRRRRLTPKELVKKFRREGWEPAGSLGLVTRLSEAGVRLRYVSYKDGSPHRQVWAPQWAIKIALHSPKKLGAAKKSIKERKAILTELALEKEKNDAA